MQAKIREGKKDCRIFESVTYKVLPNMSAKILVARYLKFIEVRLHTKFFAGFLRIL